MAGNPTGDSTVLAPDEAFSVLGNETRLHILQVLGEAATPLSFTELRNRVGIDQGRQFTYHLSKLQGHFVRKTDDAYELRSAGERVVEAVLSRAVTESPVIERTTIDWSCWFCGAPSIDVSYLEDQVGFYCSECGGNYDDSYEPGGPATPPSQDRLGYLPFPPAGIRNRSPHEVLEAALTWFLFDIERITAGLCPRCSAEIEVGLLVCDDHDYGEGMCGQCGRRYAMMTQSQCTNCIYEMVFVSGLSLMATPELRAFLIDHGLDPVAPRFERFFGHIGAYEEDIRSVAPPEAEFTFTVDGDAITLSVDENLDVVDVATAVEAE